MPSCRHQPNVWILLTFQDAAEQQGRKYTTRCTLVVLRGVGERFYQSSHMPFIPPTCLYHKHGENTSIKEEIKYDKYSSVTLPQTSWMKRTTILRTTKRNASILKPFFVWARAGSPSKGGGSTDAFDPPRLVGSSQHWWPSGFVSGSS